MEILLILLLPSALLFLQIILIPYLIALQHDKRELILKHRGKLKFQIHLYFTADANILRSLNNMLIG